ncbi:MAG: RIP metalloprotease RseP [Candidatus Paceibacterota bacterium]|jgi:regulator of sigma E protease
MSVILFIIILAVLIFVHELGHFVIAKLSGIRVDEFALGFPPTILSKKVGETVYKLNIIPFGGYVSIFGENPDHDSLHGPDSARSMVKKNRAIQASVLSAGVIFNVIFAWVLISASLALGISPTASLVGDSAGKVNGKVIISEVMKDSPAEKAGLKSGDIVFNVTSKETTLSDSSLTIDSIQKLVATEKDKQVVFGVYREGKAFNATTTPVVGVVSDKAAIGIGMESGEVIKLAWYQAPIQGFKTTVNIISLTAQGLWGFVVEAFHGKANYGQVSGPIGIVGMVGSASHYGLSYILFFTALISINLAIINILPFPALDGGRLLFVAIEAISRKSIPPKVGNALNAGGFAILILLMLLVTYHDVAKLFIK